MFTSSLPVLARGGCRACFSTQNGVETLSQKLVGGSRMALSRAITLCESRRPEHSRQAAALMQLVAEGRPSPTPAATFRVGVAGPPGAGKSTFIEGLGRALVEGFEAGAGPEEREEKEKVAVLAVDPSSDRSGGSLLGDKTRMPGLSLLEAAYVRPTPAGGTYGGVARATSDAVLLCEAAGYGVVLVETVGVGQSETLVRDLVDLVLLVLPPSGGDELQGLKKGIVEVADIIVVNKADGALAPAAKRTAMDYRSALPFNAPRTPDWTPVVQTCSSLSRGSIARVWRQAQRFQAQVSRCSSSVFPSRALD